MKKLISVLLLAALMLSMFVLPVSAYSSSGEKTIVSTGETSAEGLTYTIDADGNVIIIGYIGNETDIVIPSTIDGYTVTSIGEKAFLCCDFVSITIPDGVESIGNEAFDFCSLQDITIPSSVTYIGNNAFRDCWNIKNIYFEGTADQWASIDFASFNSQPVASYDNDQNVYMNGELLTEVEITTATEINDYAFCNMDTIESVVLSDSVKSIGSQAFRGCSSLKSVTIPDSVTSIKLGAFYSCKSLQSVVVPEGITTLEQQTFSECSSLQSVTLPHSLRVIGGSAFKSCTSLTSVVIPEGVATINYYAFSDCDNLKSVTLPESLVNIGDSIFDGCSEEFEIFGYINSAAHSYATKHNIPFVALDDNLEGDYEIIFTFNSDYTATVSGYKGTPVNVVIPSTIDGYTVIKIKENAFERCTSLKSIEIPDSVKAINGYTFNGCSSLTDVKIPDSVTNIEWSAFRDCSSLRYIKIPNSVTNIGNYAFGGCTSLVSIVIPDGVTVIKDNTFKDCTSLKSVKIPDSVTSIMANSFSNCTNLTSIVIPASVTNINGKAFESCSSKLVIYGYTNSAANTYADVYQIKFVPIENIIIGDVDGDKEITIMDATQVQLHLAQLVELDESQSFAADTDKNGEISILDVTNIQLFLAGIITEF